MPAHHQVIEPKEVNPKKPKLRVRDYKHEYAMRKLFRDARRALNPSSADRAFAAGVGFVMSQQKIRLAHIYLEQADVARQQSDLNGAIAGFTKAIEIYKALASDEPACWNLVADTIEKAAATYKAANKLDLAAECLAEAAQIRETLAKSEEQPEES